MFVLLVIQNKIYYNIKYSGNYIVRFFNILPDSKLSNHISPDYIDLETEDTNLDISNTTFTISNKDSNENITEIIERRPIIKRVYFLGESYNGTRNDTIGDNKD